MTAAGNVSLEGLNVKMAQALFALLELSKALASEINLDALLAVIAEHASAVVEAERSSIYIFDRERDELWTRVAQGVAADTIRVAMGAGIAGQVAQVRETANIADAYEDPRFDRSVDERSGYRTRSVICCPILGADDTLLGVIQSVNKTTEQRFDRRDEILIRAVASHAAAAIERARLTEAALDNERHEQALRLASEIQMRMLPAGSFAASNGVFDLRAELRPARSVGGDLYDYFLSGDRLHFCVGDVSGKGAGAALVMAMTKTLFRATAALEEDPARVITGISQRLHEETDPSMFVTAVCGWIDLRSGLVRYCNAGHDRPIVIPPAGAPLRWLDARPGLALGVLPAFGYRTSEAVLAPGETLFLFTDGITEATDASDGLFSLERLTATLEPLRGEEVSAVVDGVLAAVAAFAGDTQQADDLTVMAIRFRGWPA